MMYPKKEIQESRLSFEGKSSRHEKIFLKFLTSTRVTRSFEVEEKILHTYLPQNGQTPEEAFIRHMLFMYYYVG